MAGAHQNKTKQESAHCVWRHELELSPSKSAEMLSMGEVEGVPRSPPAPRTYDSELFDAYDEAAFQTHANHAMEARLNLHVSGRSGDEIDDFKLPPIQPRRCLSPTSVGHTQSTIKRQAQNSQKPKSKLRTSMTSSMRTNTPDEQIPESIPFQPQNFMSSTRLKKVHISKRHLDTFGGTEYSIPSKRGIILHSDRYSWEGARPLDGSISQRDRMRLEIDYIEKLRGLKKRKEVWPHRAEMDLLMAGRRIEFEERFDINGELQCLKSLIMPDAARDLFHGKGIRLPGNHASIKPRPNRYNQEMFSDVSASAPSGLGSLNPKFALDPDIRRGWPNTQGPSGRSERPGLLPSINRNNNVRLGIGPVSETAVSLSQARRVTKGRKPSQPPGSILPQSKPSPLPRLELYPTHSYSTPEETDPVLLARERSLSPLPQTTSPPPPANSDSQPQSGNQEKNNSDQLELPVGSPVPQKVLPAPHETDDTAVRVGNANLDNEDPAANGGIEQLRNDDTAEDEGKVKQENNDPAANVGIAEQENGDTADGDREREQEEQQNGRLQEGLSSPPPTEKAEGAEETGPSGEITQQKSPVNPLQGTDVEELVSVGERTELTETFQRLDTDMDGHVQYEKLIDQLTVPSHQEQYLKQVYDISSSQSFFGVDEFITMNALANTVKDLSGPPADAFSVLDPASLEASILRYVELFQSVDRTRKGYISMSSLREILATDLEKDLLTEEQLWTEIVHNINKIDEERLSKVEFLSLIPYFLSLSPTV